MGYFKKGSDLWTLTRSIEVSLRWANANRKRRLLCTTCCCLSCLRPSCHTTSGRCKRPIVVKLLTGLAVVHVTTWWTILRRWRPVCLFLALELIRHRMLHWLSDTIPGTVAETTGVGQFLWWHSILSAILPQLLIKLIVHAARLPRRHNRAYRSLALHLALSSLISSISIVFRLRVD